MNKQRNEKIAVLVGIVLIVIVTILTIVRSTQKQEPSNTGSNPEEVTLLNTLPTISVKELQKRITDRNQLSLVDIRSAELFATEHLLDAISLPLNESVSFPDIPKENAVIIISEGAQDSFTQTAVEAFSKRGYANIAVLEGGMTAWKNNNGQTISIGNPTLPSDQAKVSYITTEELKNSLSSKQQFIVDVRDVSAFSEGHIEGALNIPFDELEARRKEIPSTRKIIVCGQNEIQEFQASVKINDLLLASPYVLKGSVTKWKEQGFPLVK